MPGTGEERMLSVRVPFFAAQKVAIGTKRTLPPRRLMSAFGGKADMPFCTANVRLCPKAEVEQAELNRTQSPLRVPSCQMSGMSRPVSARTEKPVVVLGIQVVGLQKPH